MTPSKLAELILLSTSHEDLQAKVRQQMQKEHLLSRQQLEQQLQPAPRSPLEPVLPLYPPM